MAWLRNFLLRQKYKEHVSVSVGGPKGHLRFLKDPYVYLVERASVRIYFLKDIYLKFLESYIMI